MCVVTEGHHKLLCNQLFHITRINFNILYLHFNGVRYENGSWVNEIHFPNSKINILVILDLKNNLLASDTANLKDIYTFIIINMMQTANEQFFLIINLRKTFLLPKQAESILFNYHSAPLDGNSVSQHSHIIKYARNSTMRRFTGNFRMTKFLKHAIFIQTA